MSEQTVRTALLTGATGFIGGHLARALLKEGWDLHVIVRPEFGSATLEDILPQLHLHTHDGSTEQLLQIVADCSPDVVFHLASLFLAQHSPSDIAQLVQSNVTFATQLTESMVQNNSWRLINTGTSWEHYESAAYNPVNLYAATKQAFQSILAYYLATTPLKAITLKLFDTYGPGDPRPKLFALLQKVAAEGKPLAMSQGEQLIDLVYIDDIVRAYLMAADCLLAGEVVGHEQYAVSSGKPLRLRELVELYSKVTGKKLPIQWGARPYRQREVMIPWHNGTALAGWRPEVDLIEGIRRIEAIRVKT
jgi:nucleoside-diphosphate-sugar epimerase